MMAACDGRHRRPRHRACDHQGAVRGARYRFRANARALVRDRAVQTGEIEPRSIRPSGRRRDSLPISIAEIAPRSRARAPAQAYLANNCPQAALFPDIVQLANADKYATTAFGGEVSRSQFQRHRIRIDRRHALNRVRS